MKKGLLAILFLLALTVIVPASPAQAQLFKNLFKKKKGSRKEHREKESSKEKGNAKHWNETTGADDNTANREDKKARREQRKREKEERKRLKRERKAAKKNKDEAAKGNKNTKSTARETSRKPVKTPRTIIPERRNEVSYASTELKERYRIDVVAPLYLDELVQGGSTTFRDHVPDKAAAGLAFYQGVKLAADTLQKAGYNMDIYLHDAGSISESVDNLVSKHLLDSTDLVIGAVTGHDIPGLAAYAKNNKVNFVSALSAADGNVKDNPYFTVLQPTLKTHCEWIVDNIVAKYPGQKVSLLYRTAIPAEENAYKYITAAVNGRAQLARLQCNVMPRYEALNTVFDSAQGGTVIMAILDTTLADSILLRMSKDFPVTHFEVFGMPSWYGLARLTRPESLKNLAVHVTHPFNVNTTAEGARPMLNRYRRDYGGKPSELVMRGYEATLWYASLLKKYGNIFNQHYDDISGAPFSVFDVKPQFDKQGFILFNENRKIYHSVYEAGALKSTE